MPRGNWRIIVAVVGFVIGVFFVGTTLAWVLWPGAPDLPDYGWHDTATSDYQPGGSRCSPANINRLGTHSESSGERQACEDAAEQHRLQANDLIQQTRAADAASQGVWVAYWQSKATVFGLIVGFFTLAAAAAAAYFAKLAADETKRSANSAIDALSHAKETAERELRAYLFPEDAKIVLSEGNQSSLCSVSLSMRNSGQTPARLIFYRISARFRSPKTVVLIPGDNTSEWRNTIEVTTNVQQLIGPNGRTIIPLETSLNGIHFDHASGRVGLTHGWPKTIIQVRLEWSYTDYLNRQWTEAAVFNSPNIKWNTRSVKEVDLLQTEAKNSAVGIKPTEQN